MTALASASAEGEVAIIGAGVAGLASTAVADAYRSGEIAANTVLAGFTPTPLRV